MILEHPDRHLTDQEFYTHLKFSLLMSGGFDEDEDSEIALYRLSIGEEEYYEVFSRIYMAWQFTETSVIVEKDSYEFEDSFDKAKEEVEKKPDDEKNKLKKLLDKISKGKGLKAEEIGQLSWVWDKIYGQIRFTPRQYKVWEKVSEIFQGEIDKYLDSLINDNLQIAKKNYYKFERQKDVLIRLIEEDKKIGLYGKNFIITEKIDDAGNVVRSPDFCIIQTVYALQKLGYLKVNNVWESYEYTGLNNDKTIRFININLTLEDVFVEEINNRYKRENPKVVIEKFDAKTGLLTFSGQQIELSKKGKETDSVLLMKTLLKSESNDWLHNDQILEDWGYTDDDIKAVPKNKVYFAGLKINNAVALKTKLDDLIEINTTKARINPKYRKVDE